MFAGDEEIWITHYSSNHQILLVGEGNFSFSLSLATAFGSGDNMVATTFDSYDEVIKKYSKGKYNLMKLERLGGTVFYDVDATKMRRDSDLVNRRFDMILFNFPHCGFPGSEGDSRMIGRHRKLLNYFFANAKSMLRPNGEIHVNHKTTPPFSSWRLNELASVNYLELIECVEFKRDDYPFYRHKRGFGPRCDQPFPLGNSSTFKYRLCVASYVKSIRENQARQASQRFSYKHNDCGDDNDDDDDDDDYDSEEDENDDDNEIEDEDEDDGGDDIEEDEYDQYQDDDSESDYSHYGFKVKRTIYY